MKRHTGTLLLTLAMLAACGNASSPTILEQSSEISGCGGFRTRAPSDDCDAEVLRWSFDTNSGTLTLRNENVVLNCCGDHSVEVDVQDGSTLVMTETDAPEGGHGRCRCICTFDFGAMVKLVDSVSGKMAVKVMRLVTDGKGGEEEVLTTTIDLDAGSGSYCSSDPSTLPPRDDEGCDTLTGDAKRECLCKAKGKSGLRLNKCVCRAKGKSGMSLHRCACKKMGKSGTDLLRCICGARVKAKKGGKFVRCVKRLQKKAKKQAGN